MASTLMPLALSALTAASLPPPTPLQIKQWQKARVEALQIPAEAEQEAAKPEPETVPQ